jgi:hypothetical protein
MTKLPGVLVGALVCLGCGGSQTVSSSPTTFKLHLHWEASSPVQAVTVYVLHSEYVIPRSLTGEADLVLPARSGTWQYAIQSWKLGDPPSSTTELVVLPAGNRSISFGGEATERYFGCPFAAFHQGSRPIDLIRMTSEQGTNNVGIPLHAWGYRPDGTVVIWAVSEVSLAAADQTAIELWPGCLANAFPGRSTEITATIIPTGQTISEIAVGVD